MSNFETKIAQVEKKAKHDVDNEKSEKEKALAKVGFIDKLLACFLLSYFNKSSCLFWEKDFQGGFSLRGVALGVEGILRI